MFQWIKQWLAQRTPPRQPRCARQARLELEGLEQRQVPAVTFPPGGAVLPNVEVQALYYGSDWSNDTTQQDQQTSLETYLHGIVQSSYMDMLHKAYSNVNPGSFDAGLVDPVALDPSQTLFASKSHGSNSIEGQLQAQITAGNLASPDSNRLYIVFVEKGITIEADDHSTSANSWAGIHGDFQGQAFNGKAIDIPYAIIAYPDPPSAPTDPSILDQMTQTTSHELAEAVTDPFNSPGGWYDNDHNGEIGDLAIGQAVYLNGFAVQRIVDQKDQPMTPAGAMAIQNVSFVLGSDHQLWEYGNGSPKMVATGVASVSNQGIDNQGYAMVDYVTTTHRGWEYQDDLGRTKYLGAGVKSAAAGQGVSYVLYTTGLLREFHDPTPGYTGFNTNARWTTIASSIRAIDAGTDMEGVNAVDAITTRGVANQYSDAGGKSLIATGVKSLSAGQQGISAYVDTLGNASSFDQSTGAATALASGVATVSAGVDANGHYQFELLDAFGNGSEIAFGGSVTSLGSGLSFLSKARGGLIDEVLSSGTAQERNAQGNLNLLPLPKGFSAIVAV